MKLPDWESRLFAFAEAAVGRPFLWGEWDCVLLTARALDAMGAHGLTEKYQGAWHGPASALRYARRFLSVTDGLQRAGCRPVRPGFQQVGDILLVRQGPFELGHVCLGSTVLSVDEASGVFLGRMDAMPAFSAWRL